MKVKTTDLHWLAGVLEGEGSFTVNRGHTIRNQNPTPIISLQMCDYDIVRRVCYLLDQNINIVRATNTHRPVYRVSIANARAIGWMFTLYLLMGERRREQIRIVVDAWKSHKARIRARTVWRKYGKKT